MDAGLAGGPTRFLVVDSYPVVCEGLRQLVNNEADMRVQWVAYNPGEALALCETQKPDFVITDISLNEDSDGLHLIEVAHDRWPSVPVMVMSMHDACIYAESALRAGARGYINKNAMPTGIIKAIRHVLQGEIYLGEQGRTAFIERLVSVRGAGEISGGTTLTQCEREVFRLIGLGLKKSQIAERLRRSTHTIEAHRAKMKKKLGVTTGAELARLAFLCSERSSALPGRRQGNYPARHAALKAM